MAGISRVNGFDNYVVGAYRSSANIGAFLLTVQNASDAAQDIRAEDDAANEACELILSVVQPLAYCFVNDNSGQMSVVVDGHSVTAASLQGRIRELGATAGPNDYDASGATVTAATTFVVA